MTHPVTGVDHVLLIGDDLDGVAASYGRLGFTLSPRGQHPPAKGTANHTIMLDRDYIELLGLMQRTDLNRPRFNAVQRDGQGLHAVCCRIADAGAAATDLAALGVATQTPTTFERAVPLPDGTTGRAAFSTLNFAQSEVPLGLMFMCQHQTPETVWLPELMRHANSAIGIASVMAVSDDPGRDAAGFVRLFRNSIVTRTADGAVVETGRNSARIVLRNRAALTGCYPAGWIDATPRQGHAVLQVRVAQIGAALDCLRLSDIAAVKTATGHAISPDLAGGVILEFTEA